MTTKHFYFSKEELAKADSFQKEAVKAAFQLAYGTATKWKIEEPVKVPGAYDVWSAGTNGDVTLLAWYHSDGSVTTKAVAW